MMVRAWILVFAVACSSKSGGSTTTPNDPNNQTAGSGDTAAGGGSGATASTVTVGAALQITPTEATVTIDDIVMGRAVELDPVIALAPGLHTLVVAQPGFKPYRMEFAVTDKIESFTIKLDPAK